MGSLVDSWAHTHTHEEGDADGGAGKAVLHAVRPLSKQINTLSELTAACSTARQPPWRSTGRSLRLRRRLPAWDRHARLQEELAAAGQAGKNPCISAPPTAARGLAPPPCSWKSQPVPSRNWRPLHSRLPAKNRSPAGGDSRNFPGNPAPGGRRKTARRLPEAPLFLCEEWPSCTAHGSPGKSVPGGHMPPHWLAPEQDSATGSLSQG